MHLPQIELPAVSQSADRVPYDSIKRLQRGGRPFKIHDLSEICALPVAGGDELRDLLIQSSTPQNRFQARVAPRTFICIREGREICHHARGSTQYFI